MQSETPDPMPWSKYLNSFPVPWKDATVLVTGVDANDIGHDIHHQHDAAEVWSIGVDQDWEKETSRLGQRTFDIVVSHRALSGLTPSEQHSRLLWFADRLTSAGHLVVSTQTFLAPRQHTRVGTEGAHVVFPQRTLRRHYEDELGEELDYASPQTASSYIMLFRRTGFEIVAAESAGPQLSDEVKRRFGGKLRVLSAGDLDAAGIICHLRKRTPANLDDIERASADALPEIGTRLAWAPLPDASSYRVSREGAEGSATIWHGDGCECTLPLASVGEDRLRVEAKRDPDSDYFTLVPFAVPTPARDDPALLWLGPPANSDDGMDAIDETELFRGAMKTSDGEGLELTINQVRLPGREVAFLSHSRPSRGLENGLLVVGERHRAVLYCSADLGQTWTSVSLMKRFDRAIARHFLLSSGHHLVMAPDPVSASLIGPGGESLANFDDVEEIWHGSWSVDESRTGTVMFAEYRPTGKPVGGELHVWRSVDGCMSWSSALAVPGRTPAGASSIRHFHTCQADPHHPGRWYVSSGDAPTECAFWLSDDDGLNWRRVEPTFPANSTKPELATCLLRTTSFLVRPDHLLWATDDKRNHERAVTIRLESDGSQLNVEDELGRNLMRSLVDLGVDGLSIAISESKHNRGAVAIYLLDRNGLVASQLALHNTRRQASGFTYSTASRVAANGTFFSPSDGSVLSAERDGFLRWHVRQQDPLRALPADLGGEPFAVVGDREVCWFPTGFAPKEDDLIAFFHTQRTGGISFRRQLRRAYGDDAVYSLTTLADRYQRWGQLLANDLAGYRVYAGHAPYGEKPMARRWLAVGMVRDPLARIVSLYRMIRDSDGYGDLSVAGEDLESWVRKVHELKPDYVSDAQTYFLCGAPDADYALGLICERYLGVGLTEHQDTFMAEMARAMRWPEPEPVHLNATKRAMDFEVSDGARELILGLNQEDQRVYDFVRDAWRVHSNPQEAA